MPRRIVTVILGSLLLFIPLLQSVHAARQMTQDQKKYYEWAKALWNSLDRRHGVIALPNGVATLKVPDNFYYLGPNDADKVMMQVWHIPPGPKTLGMLMPEGMTPFQRDAWAVTIKYSKAGYVSDNDADDVDYDGLLKKMQEQVRLNNKQRMKQGYDPMKLIGWAVKPDYDKAAHELHWAKELQFGNDNEHSLNYNIRVLGRKGYLQLNFFARMDQKPMIDSKIDSILAMASFNPGDRYSDFNPDQDKVAAYGLGGLVAGPALSKTGILTSAPLLKNLWIILLAGLVVVAGLAWVSGLSRMIGRRKTA